MATQTQQNAILFCNSALSEIGTRSRIASLSDGSQEAFFCALHYGSIRDHLLRAVHWNFAKRSDLLTLWKALPGTPENTSQPSTTGWIASYPAAPWIYSYVYPDDCVKARRVIGQVPAASVGIPIFSGGPGMDFLVSKQRLLASKFEVASDLVDANGTAVSISQGYLVDGASAVAQGSGYIGGDILSVVGGTSSSGPAQLVVREIGSGGAITGEDVLFGGRYSVLPPFPVTTTNTNGVGFGATFQLSYSRISSQRVILTNQESPVFEYTYLAYDESMWDSSFCRAFIKALAGHLAQPLTGDKALAAAKLQDANATILAARISDGNEGLTINDHMPDWLQIRGIGGMIGFETFSWPLGPLFSV